MKALLPLTAALLLILSSTLTLAQAKPPRPTQPRLRTELLAMVAQDQAIRNLWIKNMADTALIAKMKAVDAGDTKRMKAIVARYGWPGKSLVGRDGANAAWLLVQHADHDPAFQTKCLALMAAEPTGEIAKPDLALLTDRVLIAQGKKQRYGTQFGWKAGDVSNMTMKPTEDVAHLDERRAAMGLQPIAEYEKVLKEVYAVQPKTPQEKKTP